MGGWIWIIPVDYGVLDDNIMGILWFYERIVAVLVLCGVGILG